MKFDSKTVIIGVISIWLFTFLRSFLILFSPVILIFLHILFRQKITVSVLFSFFILLIGLTANFVWRDFYWTNTLVSLLIFYLPLVVLLAKPKKRAFSLETFMFVSSYVLIAVNITAYLNFFYVLISGNGLLDDSFLGVYGSSGLSIHTLCITNFIYSIYYLSTQNYSKGGFFFFSGFMGFYGLGLVLLIATLGLILATKLKKKHLKYLLALPILVSLVIVVVQAFNPTTISYLENNIKIAFNAIGGGSSYQSEMNRIKEFKMVETPRKILAFKGSFKTISDPFNFFFGTSPGTYNSRTSFLLNGEYTTNPLFKKIKNRPYYAEQDIFPLWNNNIVYQYNDGTRNEPFSSIISLFLEYGAIQGFFILLFIAIKYRRIKKNTSDNPLFVRFLFLFGFLNVLTENYIEYAEVFILLLIIVKSLESKSVQESLINE